MSNRIYLAILEDRHIDDDIRCFHVYELAKEQIKRWMKEYDHVTDYENEFHGRDKELSEDGFILDLWQANENQEEGLVMSILEKKVHG